MLQRFKEKWDITSNMQLVIILLVFALTGSTSLYVRKAFFFLLNIDANTSLWIKVPAYIAILIPAYYVLLICYAWIFGQFKFFWELEKKTFKALFRQNK